VAAAVEESRRLLEVRNAALQDLQQQAASEEPPAEEAPVAPTEPGVDLEAEGEQVFADETPEPAPAAEETPAPAPAQRPVAAEPSFVAQALGWVLSPFLWIGLGVAALLLTALWYMRRRRQVAPEDVTGRWEALESEVADDEVREATARMRRQVPEETIVVEEQPPERHRAQAEPAETPRGAASPRGSKAAPSVDDTLSSQAVINLDQADAVAEADFHMAYGLYDQAAELVQKALDAAPNRRDLKLKLLEVFFVWGNKDSFLKGAQSLRKEIGQGGDPDWDKVVIMGRQICPDERLFTEATTGSGGVDVDLQAGDSPLDLAFDEVSAAGDDHGTSFNLRRLVMPAPTCRQRGPT
jgi:pilus assembly protein FimV